MIDGGYYFIDLAEFRFLSLNGNYWANEESRDPDTRERQRIWLTEQLEECLKIKKKVLIGTHHPLTESPHYSSRIGPLLLKYRDIISLTVTGHHHDTVFYISEDGEKHPYGV